MDIEYYNMMITKCISFKIHRNETVTSRVNIPLLERLKEHWKINGCATDEDIKKSKERVRIIK